MFTIANCRPLLAAALLAMFLGAPLSGRSADEPAPAVSSQGEAPQAPESPSQAAWKTAIAALQKGPQSIVLKDQATLALPVAYGFVPLPQAKTLMEALGNTTDDNFIGLVFPLGENDDWMATVDFDPAGYIKDDDAKNWKAGELLENLKKGTEAGNERREKLGYPGLEVTRWIEPPAYQPATQRLVWSIEAREKGAPASADATVNYNTYVLGREGYVSLDLISAVSKIEAEKPAANTLLSAVSFNAGKRYADFNSSTDKIAAYGLAALVGGLAIKKLGLLALGGLFFAKFAKVILLTLAGGAAVFRKFFTGKKS